MTTTTKIKSLFGVRTQTGWLYRLRPRHEHRVTFGPKRSALALDRSAAQAHLRMVREIAPHLRCRVLPLTPKPINPSPATRH